MSVTHVFASAAVQSLDFIEAPDLTGAGDLDPPRLTSATIRLWKAFAPLAFERRRWALAAGKVEPARAGDVYAAPGEVAVVVSGCLGTDAAGSGLAAEILGPGDVVATGSCRPVTGRWITDGEVFRVSLQHWTDSAGMEGVSHLLEASDRRRAILERRILCATTHRATARIADLFLSVHEAAPTPQILLSQERLGMMLGLRRTTVNGSCRALEDSGALRTKRGGIRLMDVDILERAACGCRCAGLSVLRCEPDPYAG